MTWLRRLLLSVGFLTRIPVRAAEATAEDLAASIGFFPLVGWGLGLLLGAAAGWIPISLTPLVVGTLLVAVLAGITGGLHLDGLADVFDALGGGRGSRERMLEILRDPRIGAHGATALVLVLLAKSMAVGALVTRGEIAAVVAFPAVARFAVVPLLVAFPAARSEGLGQSFRRRAGPRELVVAAIFGVVGMAFLGTWYVRATIWALAIAGSFGIWLWRRLGGLNGDCYGAAVELAEVAFLLAAVGK